MNKKNLTDTAIQKEYWNERVSKHNHTGWADEMIYAFDQYARIKIIKEIIKKLYPAGGNAFDFGCGTGDFSRLLAAYYDHVIGFDISEKVIEKAQAKSIMFPNIQYHSGDYKQINIKDHSLNIILCITVLDHIKEDAMLMDVLNYFREKLSEQGCLTVMEYALKTKTDAKHYQRMDTFETWKERFKTASFVLDECYGYFHPDYFASKYFLKYKKNLWRIFLSYFKRFSFIKKYLLKIAEKYAANADDLTRKCTEEDYLRIMIFKKINS